jgi:hypothetical protein
MLTPVVSAICGTLLQEQEGAAAAYVAAWTNLASGALKALPQLTTLKIQHCKIGSAAAGVLLQAIKGSNTLRCLDLTDNDADCAQAVADVLAENKSLHELDLSFNNFGHDAAGLQLILGKLKVCITPISLICAQMYFFIKWSMCLFRIVNN